MAAERDRDADELFVDHCLQQELGGQQPPDYAERIAARSPEEIARAAARVASAESARTRIVVRRRLALVAAASLLVGLLLWQLPGTVGEQRERASEQALALVDAFHAAMPTCPTDLRDAGVRREVAPRALPVLAEIVAFHAAHADERVFGRRVLEFEIYQAVLGGDADRGSLRDRATAGDVGAAVRLAAAELIRSSDDVERGRLLAELQALLVQRADLAASVAQCLIAAELSVQEATQLATGIADPVVAQGLVRSAELASPNPRRLLGQPLELYGRLVDDRSFSTNRLRGKVVLVCFWASWCAPCAPVLERVRTLRSRYPELAVVGVSCDHSLGALQAHLDDHPWHDWLEFFDRGRPGWHELAFACGVRTVPYLLLLDRAGVVCEVDVGRRLEEAVVRQLTR